MTSLGPRELEINRKQANVRQLLNAIADEYAKAVVTNRLGAWQAAAISVIEMFGGEDVKSI